ncbi:uncharacterized protein FOMMEDRAFT_20129 [Fomitiporia mediterranea MF3/22]|uniref:uncharacterized protein n=1 Tax=Fomitiporia mediterranea (strain MF3/22) TaxID=694068 RepID=UPI00044073D5|nr:uncharacterized protein FOMMEDRAFT_20129 [Fomitiporia mediterranea MF3/22]EJD02932.1 hypothetical protein FOMMEDRAFT_20129 [Fomitiporia mediterranea MF3/22]
MPPRRKLPARRASLRAQRYPPSPPEPAIETMEVEGSGEDMDVSDEEVQLDGDGASSEAGGAPDDDASGSEGDQEDEIDVEDNDQDGLGEDDDEDQEDELSSSPSPTPPPKPTKAKSSPGKPRLKIKLKFSGVAPSNTTPTPSDEMPLRPGRKGHPKHVDVESEDDDDSSSESQYTGPTRLTQRQAALAGMVESAEHMVLEETVSKKKKHLNETELALKREETARKRKNLSAKKLEDEKIETINRLLRKQTRPRGKRGAIAEADEEGEQEEDASVSATPPIVPTLFRWVSSTKPDSPALSFSVPPSLMPESSLAQTTQSTQPTKPPQPKPTPLCDVRGCKLPRKYKLVKDPSKGGCGMEHLKALQAKLVGAS